MDEFLLFVLLEIGKLCGYQNIYDILKDRPPDQARLLNLLATP